jgi:hypothetical protein
MGNAFNLAKSEYQNEEVYKNIVQWARSNEYRPDKSNKKYGLNLNDLYKEYFKKRACCTGNNNFLLPFPAFITVDEYKPVDPDVKYLYTIQKGDISGDTDEIYTDTLFAQYSLNISALGINEKTKSDKLETNDPRCKMEADTTLNYSDGFGITEGKAFNSNANCASFYTQMTDNYMNTQGKIYNGTDKSYNSLYQYHKISGNTNATNYNEDLLCYMSPYVKNKVIKALFEEQSSYDVAMILDDACKLNEGTTTFKASLPRPITIQKCVQSINVSGQITSGQAANLPQSCTLSNTNTTVEGNTKSDSSGKTKSDSSGKTLPPTDSSGKTLPPTNSSGKTLPPTSSSSKPGSSSSKINTYTIIYILLGVFGAILLLFLLYKGLSHPT